MSIIAKKKKKNIVLGVVHISTTFNNIHVTVTDPLGNVILSTSAGAHNFKGSKKSTPYAAQVTTEHAVKVAMEHGMKTVSIKVSGPGPGGSRDTAVRTVKACGLEVIRIRDVTKIPHGGCKLKGRRRV